MNSTILERLSDKISPEPNSGCWLWTGALSTRGYARIWHQGQMRQAHRIMYEMTRGSIPNPLVIDHLCRVRHCVNPDHMEVVTNRENLLRGVGITAKNYRKTHCIRGHIFNYENTVILPSKPTVRHCRKCKNLHWRRWWRSKHPNAPIKILDGIK